MIQDFFIPFIATAAAEFGDKTQLAVLCLSAKTKKHLSLLLGIILAFAAADGLAVLFGDFLTKLVPLNYIKIGSGILFIIFGIITLREKDEDEKKCEMKNPFMSGFTVLLVSEMGDKTQMASALFATKFNPWMVFFGVISAMAILSSLVIYLGKLLAGRIPKKLLHTVAGIIFIIIGIFCLF
jgi:Ca2+/H+ antiporter, TMEM165/GDT1 family